MREVLTDKYWMSPFNFLDEVRDQLTLPVDNRVYIHDVTLREAEQAPGIVFKTDEKIAIAKALDEMGVRSIELFPVVSDEDAALVTELIKMKLNAEVVCLARWLKEDIDVVLKCGAREVLVESNVNPWTLNQLWGLSEDDIIKKFTEAAKYAKSTGLIVSVMPWDAFRAPLSFLERLYKELVYTAGVDRMTIADTSGVGIPWATAHIIRKLREWAPHTPIEMHAHNEMGLATTAMLSAVVGGASYVHTSMIGLGHRGGNAATEEVIMALELLLGVDTGIRLDRIYPTALLVSELAKFPIVVNKPIVGENLFRYEAGLSVFIFEKVKAAGRPFAYVPFMPELIGRRNYEFVLGKMSGNNSIKLKAANLNIELTEAESKAVTAMVKTESILRKAIITDDIFIELVRKVKENKNVNK
jgi:isopropylmalate/homocitrate/citramalate synthase